MNKAHTRIFKKVLSSLLLFLLFIYFTVLICTLPRSFTIKTVEGQMTSTHTGFQIVRSANEKFFSLLKLDLGSTGKDNRPLIYLVKEMMKNSIILIIWGFLLCVVVGLGKGIADSRRGNRKESSLKVLMTIIPISLPDVLIIALLQRLAVYLTDHGIDVFKIGGIGTIQHLYLPIIALSILPSCYIARMTSMSIESSYNQDYIKVAAGKGCSDYRILWNHVMRNVLPAVIDSLPAITTIMISNLMMVEYLFSYPGLTLSLFKFFKGNERDGTVLCIILLGVIYFLMEALFKLIKWAAVKQVKEGAL